MDFIVRQHDFIKILLYHQMIFFHHLKVWSFFESLDAFASRLYDYQTISLLTERSEGGRERGERCLWQMKRPERVAAVGDSDGVPTVLSLLNVVVFVIADHNFSSFITLALKL